MTAVEEKPQADVNLDQQGLSVARPDSHGKTSEALSVGSGNYAGK